MSAAFDRKQPVVNMATEAKQMTNGSVPECKIWRYGADQRALLASDWSERDCAHWWELCSVMLEDPELCAWYDIHHMEWQSLRFTEIPSKDKLFTPKQKKKIKKRIATKVTSLMDSQEAQATNQTPDCGKKDPGGVIYVALKSPRKGQAAIRIGPTDVHTVTLLVNSKVADAKVAWADVAATVRKLTVALV